MGSRKICIYDNKYLLHILIDPIVMFDTILLNIVVLNSWVGLQGVV